MSERLKDCLIAIGSILFLAGIVFGAAFLVNEDEKKWEKFRLEHKCKIVSKTQAETISSIGSDGKLITTTVPAKTGWLCDDGIIYWR